MNAILLIFALALTSTTPQEPDLLFELQELAQIFNDANPTYQEIIDTFSAFFRTVFNLDKDFEAQKCLGDVLGLATKIEQIIKNWNP